MVTCLILVDHHIDTIDIWTAYQSISFSIFVLINASLYKVFMNCLKTVVNITVCTRKRTIYIPN